MNIFDELENLYSEIDDDYASLELQSRAIGHNRKERGYQRKRELNDQAYFLFMFSRLEERIKELSDELIDTKYNTLSSWPYKRTWDILYKRKSQINFMDRVALLTEIGKTDYNLIGSYYQQRNNIAHGSSFSIPINIPTVVSHFKRFYYDLK